MGCLYRQFKAKVEGSSTKTKTLQKKGSKVGASGCGGEAICALSEIMTQRSRSVTLKLQGCDGHHTGTLGSITVRAKETIASRRKLKKTREEEETQRAREEGDRRKRERGYDRRLRDKDHCRDRYRKRHYDGYHTDAMPRRGSAAVDKDLTLLTPYSIYKSSIIALIYRALEGDICCTLRNCKGIHELIITAYISMLGILTFLVDHLVSDV